MGSVIQGTVYDASIGVVPSASIEVRNEVTSALATLFSDIALSVSVANPFTADSNGFYQFYTSGGLYRITATSGLFSQTHRNVAVGEAAAHDVGTSTGEIPTVDDVATGFLKANNNLSDVVTPSVARTHLGLGDSATHPATDFATPANITAAIAALGSASTYDVGTSGSQVPTNAGVDAKIAALGTLSTQDADDVALTGRVADQGYVYSAPVTGFNTTIADTARTLLLDPAGTLATGTVTMPAAPVNGHEIRIATTQTITALTVAPNSGQTIVGAPTTLVAGTGAAWIYVLAQTKWVRLH